MGWLHAIPKSKANNSDARPRQKRLADEGAEIEYPLCTLMYMVDYLFSAGPSESTPMGASPLSHQEIYAWQQNMQIDLCPWEANCLREMSRHYLSQMVKSDTYDAPPPWVPEIDEEKGHRVAEKLKGILRD